MVLTLFALLMTQAAAVPVVVFDDDFSDNRHEWSTGRGDHSDLQVREGRYYFAHFRRSNDDWMTWRTVRTHHDTEFQVEATITQVDGPVDAGYGLIFGATGTSAFKSFLVTRDGRYRFGERDKGRGFQSATGWRRAASIRTGQGATNVLAIRQAGDSFRLFVNGEFVERVPATPFAGHKMGFQIWRRQTIAVDRLRVVEHGEVPEPPVPDRADRQVVLKEDFVDNRGGWALADDDVKYLAVESGDYVFEHRRKERDWLTWRNVGLDPDADYRVEAEIRKTSGILHRGYGLVFGLSTTDDFLTFMVSGDGQYRYGEQRGGHFSTPTGWVKHPAVKVGNGAANTLAVHRRGDTLHLFVNGERVDRVAAKMLPSDGVGFQVNGRQRIRAGDLTVSVYTGQAPVLSRPAALDASLPGIGSARPGRMVVAVFEIEDAGGALKAAVRSQLTDYFSALLTQKGGYAVVPFPLLRELLHDAKAESYRACYDESCQIEVGKAAAAEAVIATKLLRIGDMCALTSTVLDLEKETTVRAATAETSCEASTLLSALRTLAEKL